MKLTILVDNLAKSGLVVEHGFSAWIEVPVKAPLRASNKPSAFACKPAARAWFWN
jgi:metal-dependent hydrolase (beta-lactamase superfamily II)